MHVIPTADVFLHLPSAKMPGAAIEALSGTTEAASSTLQAFFTIGFTHHRYVIEACKQLNERWYYIKRCAAEFWTVEALKSHLKADDYHRYGSLPNNFALTFPDASLAAKAVRAFKDEYLLDYINIEEAESLQDIDERVLNRTLVLKIKRFIQSLGHDFCFIADDYRLIVDDDEWFVDLLFFNRTMKCLVAIELKRGKFKPAYLGQLNYYLSVLDDKERHSDENPSIGLILCQEAKRGVVELAIRDFGKPMGVATYRLEQNVPENYKPLQPLVNGVQQILDKGAEDKISASK
jgi:predicted nuclease of restriction endonuclease-like (RecB) superfamily